MTSKKRNLLLAVLVLSMVLAGCAGVKPTSAGSAGSSVTSVAGNSGSTDENSSSKAISTGGSLVSSSDQAKSEVFSGSIIKSSAVASSQSRSNSRSPSTSASVDNGYKANTYAPFGRDIMPIGAWVSPPPANYGGLGNPNYITNENYKVIAESGINFVHAIYERADLNINDVFKALDYAAANGIKYLVRDSQVMTGIDDPEMMNEALARYKNKPAYLGNMMFDEPATSSMDDLGACYGNYKKSLPGSMFYINLLPTYASRNQLFIKNTDGGGGASNESDYRNYLQTYIDQVSPKFLSYDYYPCEDSFPNLKSGYFKNMSMVRSAAMEENIPFWVFIQNCSFASYVRNPNKQEIEWQVNTALAYGAKGIQYFCYWSPIESADFSSAMVTKTGEKTQSYYYIQAMNRQIKAVDEVLMNSNSAGVIVNGESPVPIPGQDVLATYKELKKVEGTVPSITGCFNHEGKSAFYVVNNSIQMSGKVTLTFTGNKTVKITRKAVTTQYTGNATVLELDAGEGVLVRIE